MANKKIIEKRLEQERKARELRNIQIVGGIIAFLVVVFLGYTLISKGGSKQYSAPPPMIIDTTAKYFATFKMKNGGEFTAELFAAATPITVNNFVFLAREGFYDGTTFHRVIEGFMAQGGDPTGTGFGGPGYSFEDEFDSELVFDNAGILAMANSGPATNGSQFFISYGPTPELNSVHTIFGVVVEGMDVVNGITRRDPQTNPAFEGDAIETIVITEE